MINHKDGSQNVKFTLELGRLFNHFSICQKATSNRILTKTARMGTLQQISHLSQEMFSI